MDTKTILFTSVNPFGRIEYQKKCFEKWKSLGLEVKSCNVATEKELLLNYGFLDQDVVEITDGETALTLFGKPLPRILPVLNRMLSEDYDNYFLVNSDIYPVTNKNPANFFNKVGGLVALTRNEFTYVENYRFYRNSPYRGGLDIFFFDKEKLRLTFNRLCENDVSERMTFGIVGWDFYLADRMKSVSSLMIMDSRIFVHEYHEPTYCQIEEFANYSPIIAESNSITDSKDVNYVASKFVEYIGHCCTKNADLSNQLSMLFSVYSKTLFYATDEEKIFTEQVFQCAFNGNNLNLANSAYKQSVVIFIFRFNQFGNWKAALNFISKELFGCTELRLRLEILYLVLVLLSMKNQLHFAMEYPKESLHGQAVRQIATNLKGSDRDVYIFDLFASELVDHKIYNPLLLDYIFFALEAEDDFEILKKISNILEKPICI